MGLANCVECDCLAVAALLHDPLPSGAQKMKRHVIVICFLAVCFWFPPGVNGAELRTWTSKSGKFTVKAELLSFDQEVVSLRRANGKTIKVPLAKLSKEDQEYVLDQPKPKAEPVAAREEESVAELEKLGATIKRNEQGEIVEVNLSNNKDLIDAALVHLKGLTKLSTLSLIGTRVTEAGLLAHFTFDEGGYNILRGQGSETVLQDASGNGFNGVIHNAKWAKTAGGGALKFARTDSYVDLGTDLSNKLDDEMTIMAWVKLEAGQYPGVNTNWTIVDCENYKKSGFIVRIDGHNSRLSYRFSRDGVSHYRTSTITLANNTFYHIAVTRKGDLAICYIDGAIDQQLHAPATGPGKLPLLISGRGQSFEGLIDDVKIYERAFDAKEIASVYREEVGVHAGARKITTKPRIRTGPVMSGDGFSLRVGRKGGMQLRVGGDDWHVESSYSYPGTSIGYNHLSETQDRGEGRWKAEVRTRGRSEIRVSASGRFYSLERRLKLKGHRIRVSDTITNTGVDDVGVIVRNVITAGEMPRNWSLCGVPKTAWASNPQNPTVLVELGSSALGMVADDDVSRAQFHASVASNQAEFALKRLGLPPGGSINLEWDIYPLAAGEDYWTFINRIRKDWDVNFTIPGPVDFIHLTRKSYWNIYRDEKALSAFLKRTKLKVVQLGWLDFNNHNVQFGGFISRGEFKDMMLEVKATADAVDPELSLLGSIEAPYSTLPRTLSKKLFEAHPLTKDTYAEFAQAQMKVLQDHPEEWARWKDAAIWSVDGKAQYLYLPGGDRDGTFVPRFALTVYPAIGNGQHEYMMDQCRFIIEEVGLDGVYIDNLNCSQFSYDKWDGFSVNIDPATGAITRRYTDCQVAGAGFRKELIEYILKAGGVCVINGHSVSRETRSLPALRFDEFFSQVDPLALADGEKPPLAAYLCQAHLSSPFGLGFKPDSLGKEGASNYAKVIMKAVISYLRHGILYCHYETMIPEAGEGSGEYGPINHMFPITPVRIGEGFVEGEERSVTCVSRSFDWPGKDPPKVLLFDITGRAKAHKMKPVRAGAGWRVDVAIADWQEIAVVEADHE